jgi:hypothetical protein
MADHLEPGRDLLQHLGHVRAQLREMRTAAAGADLVRMMDDLLARQMIRQGTSDRLAPLAPATAGRVGTARQGRRRARRFAFLEVLEHQLELVDLRVELLGRAAELHPPQLLKLRLVLLDQDAGAGEFRPCRGQFGLTFGKPGTKLGDLSGSVAHGVDSTEIRPTRHAAEGPPSHFVAGFSRPLPASTSASAPASRSLPAASKAVLPSAIPSRPSPAAR